MSDFEYNMDEMRELSGGCRFAVDEIIHNGITPFSLFFDEEKYFEYIAKMKSDIIRFLPIDYMGFKHTHRDAYIHFSTKEKIEKIIFEGYLRVDKSAEYSSIGNAVYTYPLKSGLFFGNDDTDSIFMVFEAEQEHCHITQTNDMPTCIGEADFFEDVKIINPKIYTLDELKPIIKNSFDWETAKKNYYGLTCSESATFENFTEVLEHYNDFFQPMET